MTAHATGFRRDGHLSELGIDRLMADAADAGGVAELRAHVRDCGGCKERLDAVAAWTLQIEPPPAVGLRRDGHASDLGLERLVLEPLAPELGGLRAHVAACPACAQRHAALMVPLRNQVHQFPPRRRQPAWPQWAMGMALAASLALAFWRSPVTTEELVARDDGRTKGAVLDLEVFAHDGQIARRVSDQDTVYVGERVGFRLWLRESRAVLIVGADELGNAYLCYPFTESGESAALDGTKEAMPLDDAVEMDAQVGNERLVAISCPNAFSFATVAAKLSELARTTPPADALPNLLSGCAQHEVRLRKLPARPSEEEAK